MARCVISDRTDPRTGHDRPACMVHGRYAPCQLDGQPAAAAPLHVDEAPSRVTAIEEARRRVGGARPIVVHNGTWNDGNHDTSEDPACWCGAVTIPAG